MKKEVARLTQEAKDAGERVAPRALFRQAAAGWRTSAENPKVQSAERAAEEEEARLVEDSKTWGDPGLALVTEHEQGLFIQEFIGAGALEGGKRGAGTEQARWLEEHYDGTRHEWWHGHVWESNAAGKPFWTSRLPGEIVTDPARMIPERHVADEDELVRGEEEACHRRDHVGLRGRRQLAHLRQGGRAAGCGVRRGRAGARGRARGAGAWSSHS